MALMTTAELQCMYCGNAFPINLYAKPESINCLYCLARVENDMIDKIYNAALTVADLNSHFIKYNQERNEDLFQLHLTTQEVALRHCDTP
ncbi:hypothetical protein [Streptococcus fryi]